MCVCERETIYKDTILGVGLKGCGKVVQEDREIAAGMNWNISLIQEKRTHRPSYT